MKKNTNLIVLATAACVIAIVIALLVKPVPDPNMGRWRYRMTVTVETPEGLKTGSAVREVKVDAGGLKLTPEMGPSVEVIGEAVVVDLGKRGVLFALMRGAMHGVDYAKSIPFDAFLYAGGGATREGIEHYRHLKNAKAVLEPEQYPTFARYKIKNDPSTAEIVYQIEYYDGHNEQGKSTGTHARIKDNLEDAFGVGVKINQITIEMTDDPVTVEVQRYLPSPDRKPHYLNLYDFQRGTRK